MGFWKNTSTTPRNFTLYDRSTTRDKLITVEQGQICSIPDEFDYIIKSRGLDAHFTRVSGREAYTETEPVKGTVIPLRNPPMLDGVENPSNSPAMPFFDEGEPLQPVSDSVAEQLNAQLPPKSRKR
jgi:hypothetical protein